MCVCVCVRVNECACILHNMAILADVISCRNCVCSNTAHYIGLEKVTRAHFIFLCVAYLSCIRTQGSM